MQVYGVIGNPVSHSRSPVLHNAALRQAGIDAVYIPLLVDSLPDFLSSVDSPDFRGFSVTIPHKVPTSHQLKPLASKDYLTQDWHEVATLPLLLHGHNDPCKWLA